MNQNRFNGEMASASFLGSSDLIPDAYAAVSQTGSADFRLFTNLSAYKVLAFGFSADRAAGFLHGEAHELVSSKDHGAVDFIATKVNPEFAINRASVELFESVFHEVSKLTDQLVSEPLLVTGHGLGGYVAVLFALWLQHVADQKESAGSKRPVCVTFGLPLVGDDGLERAVSERPQWKSRFLNVVSIADPVPRLPYSSSNRTYQAFGSYLFCGETGRCACFEDHGSILGVLVAVRPQNGPVNGYGDVVRALRKTTLYRGGSGLGEFGFNTLRAGIVSQLVDIGLLNALEDNHANVLIAEMEARLAKRKKDVYEPTKKLNDSKILMTCMERYMMLSRPGGGYYDAYRSPRAAREIERHTKIVTFQRMLNQYWAEFVEDKDRAPQKEGGKLRIRWLLGGTNYRRIVEPLDIAEYYKSGRRDYVAHRPRHYVLLEKWLDEETGLGPREERNRAASLTEDSCFWARVEEAFLRLGELRRGDGLGPDGPAHELEWFEGYVAAAVGSYAVSPDVFLTGSRFMEWWREYKTYRGDMYDSALARYMNNESYRSYK